MKPRIAYRIKSSPNNRRHICIDSKTEKEIINFLKQDQTRLNKFNVVIGSILEGVANSEVYGKEDVNKKCKDVTAIKLFKGGQNIRIYCKEVNTDGQNFYIIVSELLPKKKDEKASGEALKLIKKVASYEYTIAERPN